MGGPGQGEAHGGSGHRSELSVSQRNLHRAVLRSLDCKMV